MDEIGDFIRPHSSPDLLLNGFWVLANLTAFNTADMKVIIQEYKFHVEGVRQLQVQDNPRVI